MTEIKNTVNRLIRQYLLGPGSIGTLGTFTSSGITMTGQLNMGGQIISGANGFIVTDIGTDASYGVPIARSHLFQVDSNTILSLSSSTLTFADAVNMAFNATTGTKIGTATSQKLAFYNSAPIVQGSAVADAAGGAVQDAEARTALNALLARIRSLGLIAT